VTSKHAKDTESSVDSIIEELLQASTESESTQPEDTLSNDTLSNDVLLENVLLDAALSEETTSESQEEDDSQDALIASLLDEASKSGKAGEASETSEADGEEEDSVPDDAGEMGEVSEAPEARDMPALLPQIIELPQSPPVWPLFITALVLFIVLTGGVTIYNKTTLASQSTARAAVQQQGDAYLEESIALIQEADSVVIALDKARETQVTEADVPRLEALIGQLESTQRSLDSAIEKAELAKATFTEPEDQELAQHARDAAGYRKQMLELSGQLVGYDIAAMESAVLLNEAWSLLVDADADMRSAVEAVEVGGVDAVSESRDYNQAAVEKLTQVQEKFDQAVVAFPGLNLTVLTNYLVVKQASAELALASDDALLNGDRAEANAKNDEFIAKDAEAVELAALMPSSPMSLLVAIYDETTQQLREDYTALRTQAADADAFLRDYLGVEEQV
jgi:hypothetical protein